MTSHAPNADPRLKPRFKPPTKNPWFKPRFKPPECWCGLNLGLNLGLNRGGVQIDYGQYGKNRSLIRRARCPLFFWRGASPVSDLTRPISRSGFDPPARPIRVGPAPAPRGPCPNVRIHIRARVPAPGQPPGGRRRSHTGHQADSRTPHQHSRCVSTRILCLKAHVIRTCRR